MPTTITFSTVGNFTIEDDGIPGNATSIVRRDSDGAVLAVIPHPADSLVFRAIVPGVNLTLNMTDSLGTASLLIGSLTTTAETPDDIVVKAFRSTSTATLAADGAITEGGSDGSADIVANAIILSAGIGIGTGANALETQTGQIEAETTTGGINIANFGTLQVGGFSASVDGLDVVTSGDILLTNLGSITLADETSFDSVHGGDTSGNVTLIANGVDSNISSNVDQSSIIAPRGSIVLTAGRDVSFGLAGTEFGNDVRANGSIIVNAGRDFLVSGFADFFADGVLGTTGGNMIANAGRNISVLDDTGNSGSLAVLGSAGGDVILNAGPNGLVTLEPPSTNTISSGSGDVTINADRLLIGSSSGITAPGIVTFRPVSGGREISLGSLSDGATALELSDGELDRVFANTLVVGGPAAGAITVGAPIAPNSVTNFTLQSGADIFANFSLTAPNNLTLNAGDDVIQIGGTLQATRLEMLVDQVQGDDGIGGANTLLGSLAIATAGLTGSSDADALTGTAVANSIFGFGGDDLLSGGADADALDGGSGSDHLLGGDGDDQLDGGFDNDLLEGGASNDVLIGGDGGDILIGGLGDDLLEGGADNDTASYADIAGEVRIKLLTVGPQVPRAAGSDTLVSIENVITGAGNDSIWGSNGANRLEGGAGNDRLFGLRGDDILVGGDGDDQLDGSYDNDLLEGGDGNDVLVGGDGGDILIGGLGDDLLDGGAANDTASYADIASEVRVKLLTVGPQVPRAAGSDTLVSIENVIAGAGNDSIWGSDGANRLEGGAGDDRLFGLRGNDILLGGDGHDQLDGSYDNDLLEGGDSNDLLVGGAGADWFVFERTLNAATNVDHIPDFAVGVDKIVLENAIFAGLAAGALAAGAFTTGTAATDASDRIIYNPTTGGLLFDADGTGAATPVLFAVLDNLPATLSASDFLVI